MSFDLSTIKHVVVLMFENRSFDHIFGGLLNAHGVPAVDGVLELDGKTVKTNCYNLANPTISGSTMHRCTSIGLAEQSTTFTPNHDFTGMMPDLFGPDTTGYVSSEGGALPSPRPPTCPATNSGFIYTNPPGTAQETVMSYFADGALQVLHPLAKRYVVCDNWFCDMPGHTQPNRFFMHCARTGNLAIDDAGTSQNENASIFDLIAGQGENWKVYVPQDGLDDCRTLNRYVRNSTTSSVPIYQFIDDVNNHDLPFYSFLMCFSSNLKTDPVNDTCMHPPAFMQPGENYLAAVYNTLIGDKETWESTLLIVTFDENGGIYDHVPPPRTVQPIVGPPASQWPTINRIMPINPAKPIGTEHKFDFTLLGPRIPALLISPWLKPGVDSTQYQNTSILRFVEDLMHPPSDGALISLTSRDANANSIAHAFDRFGLQQVRTDASPITVTFVDYGDYLWPEQGTKFPVMADQLGTPPEAKFYPALVPEDIIPPAHRRPLGPLARDEIRAAQPPMPYQVDIAKEYVTCQPGHADSGKPITRQFPTNAALNRYVQQRLQVGRWHDEGVHLKASLQIVEPSPGQWIWELKDAGGAVLAAARESCASRELALQELDRVRFLLHELSSTP